MKLIITFFLALTSFCFSQDFWEQTNGPYGGDIGCLVINNSSGDIFAGTGDRGVFRSTDNGDNWIQINNGLTELYIECLTINSNGDIFAGTWGGGVFRSIDNGDSWTQINNGLTKLYISSLAINLNGDIFAGTSDRGVFRSTDNGDNWTNKGLTNKNIFSLAINSNGDIFAGTYDGGVFRSTDNGDNWIQINEGLTDLEVSSLAINLNGDIFAGTWDGGVFRSTDNGDSWTQINNGLTVLDVLSLANNSNGVIFAGTHRGVFRSINSTTSLENKYIVPTAFSLYQNYPNPFNPTTTIKYEIPKDVKRETKKVKLMIYDLLGREVATLVNKNQKPGYYEITWDAGNHPSGVYFYQLTTGDFVETKKMILLR